MTELSPKSILRAQHYPQPFLTGDDTIAWRIMGLAQFAQPGLACYDLAEAVLLCEHLTNEYLEAWEEAQED